MGRSNEGNKEGNYSYNWGITHRLLSSSFLGLLYKILYMNHKKELLRSLWVSPMNLQA